jgi:hypothetical protein
MLQMARAQLLPRANLDASALYRTVRGTAGCRVDLESILGFSPAAVAQRFPRIHGILLAPTLVMPYNFHRGCNR